MILIKLEPQDFNISESSKTVAVPTSWPEKHSEKEKRKVKNSLEGQIKLVSVISFCLLICKKSYCFER